MPLPTHLDTVSTRRIRDQVYDALEGWIVDGTLRPGEKMRDKEICELLGISRTPVREALLRLKEEGLVETSDGRWTRVTRISQDQARRVYPLLWTLESLAITLAIEKLNAEQIDEMTRLNEQLEHFIATNDAANASQADYALHQIFIDGSNHPELIRILKDLKRQMRRLETTYFGGRLVAGKSVAEHGLIIEALRNGQDASRVAELINSHWHASLSRMMDRLGEQILSPDALQEIDP